MSKKSKIRCGGLIFLTSFILVLCLTNNTAQAELIASLEEAGSSSSRSIDLTAVGTADWAYWWFDSMAKANEKAGATDIGELTLIGNMGIGSSWKTNFDVVFTDGQDPVSGGVDDVGSRVWIQGGPPVVDEGYELVVAAGFVNRTLKLYIQNKSAYAKIVATLGDESVETIVDTGPDLPDLKIDYVYTLEFSHPLAHELHVRYFCAPDAPYYDSVRMGAATLSGPLVQTQTKATEPSPGDGQEDVSQDVVLGWMPAAFTAPINGHKVYFSENFNDVNDGIGGITQSATSYAPPQRLDFSTTYYWRVDEVNNVNPNSPWIGRVWSFTTEPFTYPVENITATASSTGKEDMGTENTINGSGLDVSDLHSTQETAMWLSDDEPNGAWIEYELDKAHKLHEMWVWNSNQVIEPILGFGLKDVTIEYSTNGIDYTTLGTTHEFARAPGADGYAHNTTVDFGSAAAKYVRLTANSNWGGVMKQYSLSEVRFFHIPVHAKYPSPDSGATDVAMDVTLGFRAGREAAEHNVYLSADEQAVIDGNAPVITVTENSFGPLSLNLGTTYYWRVDEVNEAETTTTWQSNIWNFTTHDHLIVDDFEDYNDYPPNEIWSTWIDGYGVSTNGATVGYPNPDWNQDEHYVETVIVNGGEQAMPFFYDNTSGAAYSEGERTFAVPQDWTAVGVQTLALYFHGTAGNTGQLYVKVNGSKVVYDGDAADIQRTGWQAWNIDLASFGTSLQSVTTLAIGIDGNGTSGTLYFDDIRLYPYSRQFITPAEPNNAGLIGHWKFDGDTLDYSGLGNNGTLGGDPQWVAGIKDGALDLDGIDDYVEIDGVADYITTNVFTLTAWIKTTQTAEGSLFGTNDSGSDHELQFGVKDGNVWVDDGSETQFPPAVNDDQWYFVVYIRDGATAYIYVDGALRSTDPAMGDPASDTRWSIGQEWDPPTSSDEFEGMVDDVRFYNYALSLGEVAWLAGRTEPFDKPF